MSMFFVYYEFQLNKRIIRHLVEDLEIDQNSEGCTVRNVAENFCGLINERPGLYAKCEVHGKPGLMLRFSGHFEAECLPHPIEGVHAFIRASSEGHLELEEFKRYFEASLTCRGVPFRRYD